MYLCRNKFLKHWQSLYFEISYCSTGCSITEKKRSSKLVKIQINPFRRIVFLLCQQLDSLILLKRAAFEVANVPWCDTILPPFPLFDFLNREAFLVDKSGFQWANCPNEGRSKRLPWWLVVLFNVSVWNF